MLKRLSSLGRVLLLVAVPPSTTLKAYFQNLIFVATVALWIPTFLLSFFKQFFCLLTITRISKNKRMYVFFGTLGIDGFKNQLFFSPDTVSRVTLIQ